MPVISTVVVSEADKGWAKASLGAVYVVSVGLSVSQLQAFVIVTEVRGSLPLSLSPSFLSSPLFSPPQFRNFLLESVGL